MSGHSRPASVTSSNLLSRDGGGPGGQLHDGFAKYSEKDRDKDEGPQRTVTIDKPLAVGRFQVTLDQFAAFVEETHYDAGSKCWAFEGGKGALI